MIICIYSIINLIILLFIAKYNRIKDYYNEELEEQGWQLYTLEDCPHCKTQLDDIPTYKNYIMFSKSGAIKQDQQAQPNIKIEDIYSFPLWYNTKTQKKNIWCL